MGGRLLLLWCATAALCSTCSISLAATADSSTPPQTAIVVDALTGNDITCDVITLVTAAAISTIIRPCATLDRALALITANDTWIQLRPTGVHHAHDLAAPLCANLTIAVQPPPMPASSDFAFPVVAADAKAQWNCDDASHCLVALDGSATALTLEDLVIRAVTIHAIVHNSATADSVLNIRGCIFDGVGGVAFQTNGRFVMDDSIIQYARSFLDAPGFDSLLAFIHLNSVDAALTRSSVRHARITGDFAVRGGILRSMLPSSFVMDECSFLNNSIISMIIPPNVHDDLGGLVHVTCANCSLSVTRTSFVDQYMLAAQSEGIALHILMNSLTAVNRMNVLVDSCVFRGINMDIPPDGLWSLSGSALYIGSIYNTKSAAHVVGPDIIVTNLTMDNNWISSGAAQINSPRTLLIANSTFTRNNGQATGIGALQVLSRPSIPYVQPFIISGVTISDNGYAGTSCPVVAFSNLRVVTITGMVFERNLGQDNGGSMVLQNEQLVSSESLFLITIQNSVFNSNIAGSGGAITAKNVILTITGSSFDSNLGYDVAGAVMTLATTVKLSTSTFTNNRVRPREGVHLTTGLVREGGAIQSISGDFSMHDCTFQSNSCLPKDGLGSCSPYFTATTMSTTDFRGGALSLREVQADISACTFYDSSACSAGVAYSVGQATIMAINEIYRSSAYAGAVVVAQNQRGFQMTYSTVADNFAIVGAGMLSITSTAAIVISANDFSNSTALTGDGGIVFFGSMPDVNSLTVYYNTFTDCSAPLGGGAIYFFNIADGEMPILDTEDPDYDGGNVVSYTDPSLPVSLFGAIQASNVVVLVPAIPSLAIFAGRAFADDTHGNLNVSIAMVDAYNQTITGNRGLVVQVQVALLPNTKEAVLPALPLLSGTILQQITGDAVYSDLTIVGEPGEYELVFSIVGMASVPSLHLPLIITADCPIGLYYAASERRCRDCGADFLVFDSSSSACIPCPAGWAVTAQNGTRVCRVCPAGETSGSGGSCTPCGSNTYQPAPGRPCVSCLGSDKSGLECSNSLPAVDQGWFAFSTTDDDGSVSLQTAQCPDNFCAGSVIQAEWIDPISLANGSAVSTAPTFRSAITRFDQCKYPRLSSESNLLCGECVAGHIPWGDKCIQCDHPNGGMVFLLLILSILLVLFLLRSASLSSAAGHSVVVLYFVQTAMLEVGSVGNLLGWLNIALFSPNSTGQCIAPLTVYEQATFQIIMPLVLFAELICVGMIHWVLSRYFAVAGIRPVPDLPVSSPLGQLLKNGLIRFIADCSIDLYISATLTLLLFSYTQVTIACLSYLACVDVGGVSVVFTQPSMRCASSEYERYLGLVVLALIIYVIGFPIGVLVFLWRRRSLVAAAHTHMERQADVKKLASSDSDPVDVSSSSNPAVLHFLRRYSPLFSMYSQRAWFWQVLVLVRRTIFVTFSVSLVRSPASKFLAYSLTHLVSLQLQLYFRPFSVDFFNTAEVISHFVLILLSQTLTAVLPPYSQSTEIFPFVLVVPPVGAYALLGAFMEWSRSRQVVAQEFLAARQAHERKEEHTVDSSDVELRGIGSNDPEVMESPLHSPSAVAQARHSVASSYDAEQTEEVEVQL